MAEDAGAREDRAHLSDLVRGARLTREPAGVEVAPVLAVLLEPAEGTEVVEQVRPVRLVELGVEFLRAHRLAQELGDVAVLVALHLLLSKPASGERALRGDHVGGRVPVDHHLDRHAELAAVVQGDGVAGDPGRTAVEVLAGVELADLGLPVHVGHAGATPHREAPPARTVLSLEHCHVVAELQQLVGAGHPGQAPAQDQHLPAAGILGPDRGERRRRVGRLQPQRLESALDGGCAAETSENGQELAPGRRHGFPSLRARPGQA